MKLQGQQQISVHLPIKLHERLRRLSYEKHKSQTKIIQEALVLYDEVIRRQKTVASTQRTETEEVVNE